MPDPHAVPMPDSPRGPDVSRATLDHVVDRLAEGVLVVDAGGAIAYVNRAALRLWGYRDRGELPADVHDLARAHDLRGLDGEPLPDDRRPIRRALAGERFADMDLSLLARGGVRRRLRCAGGPVAMGGRAGAWVSFRDVSREETILAALREERDLSAALVDESPLAVTVVRVEDVTFELANQVARDLRPGVDLVGRPVTEAFPEADQAGYVDLIEQVGASGEPVAIADEPGGWLGAAHRFFSTTISRLPQPPGRPARVLIMSRETTDEVSARARAEAIAAERTRDLARARITSARLRSLVDLATAMASVEDLDRLLHVVAGEAARLLGADSASLFLLDERSPVLVCRAQAGMASDDVVGLRLELHDWPELVGVLRTGRPAVHPRADELRGPVQAHLRRFGIRSYLAVRLGTADRPLGVLFVNHTGKRHRFTRAELAFVETLTTYLSVTVERARLVSLLREAVISLQAALLPATFPRVPGLEVSALYRSASEVAQVGGDFYDLFELEDGQVVAVIGDVRGKGVAAASHTARLRYDLRLLLAEGMSPGRALTAFNAKVADELLDEEYATILVLAVDPAGGAVRWASAGHPPPLLTGEHARALPFGGSLPVGLFPDARYRTARATLAPGRCAVLYTDGVIEARSPDGEEFGTEGLVASAPPVAASAADVADTLLKEVLRHTGGHLDDDAAVLVLRRDPA